MTSVLLVDDEIDILETMRALLEEEGFHVLTATDGREAQSILMNQGVDLIITDVMMPFLSGYELIFWVRHQQFLSNLPCLLMSCVLPKVKKSEFQWDGFLKKPFTMDDFLVAVERVMGREYTPSNP